jgi:hypothetical protein
MLPITDESVGPILLITSCLTSNNLTFLLSSKWISLEVINILTTMRNTSPPNHTKYGVNAGRTNCGIPALHLPGGNRRTHIQRSKDLKIIRQLLNANATSVSSYEGSGRHGHLGSIMTNEEYFAVATDVFLPPENPGLVATIVTGITGIQIAEMGRLRTEVTRIYRTYNHVYQALTKMIIYAFKDQYLNALSDEIVGYANYTSLQLLTHLLTYYAMIAPTELRQNYVRLNTPYDPNQPIDNLF